ncbi:hypothetical protein RXV86_14010 [Alisedimentitalea sp. MJ-SS2]|uniref:hypothetical protein n=1 Tax=Aliisedimentitalea sp. MJ-SS2 TaxID=3049795 RepID=UPI0029095270|nr:hypothetical protein [Alisedimentitalea sp. MJ-SS2]MDU8928501.1 hypothetical protein [Alisedimentitalea sp. MJ-SS2]
MRHLFFLLGFVVLSACAGDPLKDVPRLQDVDVVESTPVVEAVAAPQETDEKVGFFQRVMRKREITSDGQEAAAEAVKPDGDELTVETKPVDSQVDEEPQAAPDDKPRKRGWLFGRKPKPETQAERVAPAETSDEVVPVATAETEAPADAAPDVAEVSTRKRGLFGWGGKKEAKPETLQRASLTPDTATDDAVEDAAKTEKAARTGLFSKKKAARLTGPDAREVAAGEVLPFGAVARACHVKRGQLGREVAKYPERGAKYRVYDSAPGNLGLHTFYVTGFKDGCPRQFTAALAVFGSAGMYEALRYGLPVKARSKKPTDLAYEKLKSRTCGVSRTKPCGAKIGRMEKNTVFLSLYNRFGGASGWTNLLLSDGKVLAKDS